MPDSYFYDLTAHNDDLARPYIHLREEIEKMGFKVKFTVDGSNLVDAAAIISFSNINQSIVQNISKHSKNKCILCLFEPPTVLPHTYNPVLKQFFGTIFTMFDDLIDNQTYFKIHNGQARVKIVDNIKDFNQKKFCVMINTNCQTCKHPQELYSERYKSAEYFSEKGEFDLFGLGWKNLSAAKGHISEDKLNVLKKYKFAICYENMRNQKGYITEKIFDALFGGCVPIYWGADNVSDYIPKECFIDRREFLNHDQLYQFLKSIDETKYKKYLEETKKFINSPLIEPFTVKGFVKPYIDRLKIITNIK
jgi:hypothetical protein